MAEAGSSHVDRLRLIRPLTTATLPRAAIVECGLVTLAAVFLTALLAIRSDLITTTHPLFAEPSWDHNAYIAMAEDSPFGLNLAPFGWRFLVPLVARLLPFSTQTSFLVITFSAVAATGVVIYYIGRHVGGKVAYGVVGTLLFFSLGWAVKFVLIDFWLTDAAAFLAVSLAVLFVLRRNRIGFCLAVTVGVAAKEAVIFVVPLWYTLQAQRWLDWRLARETFLLALPAVVLMTLVRLAIPARNDDLDYVQQLPQRMQEFRAFIPTYNYWVLLRDIGWGIRAHDRTFDTFLLYTTGTWGVGLFALAAIGAVRRPLLTLRVTPFLVLVYAQILFAVNIERLLVFGFPVMILLAIEGGKAVVSERGTLGVWLLALFAAVAASLNLRDPASIPLGFELQALLFIAFLAFALGLRPTTPAGQQPARQAP